MGSSIHFNQNRAVHLAMRNVYYERVVEVMNREELVRTSESRIRLFEACLQLLRVARKQAQFASRSHTNGSKDLEFHGYLDLMVGNVKGVLSMLNQKYEVERAEGFFFSFLDVNRASVELHAEDYERRAFGIIRCIHQTIALAAEPFEALKAQNAELFDENECQRYARAHQHFSSMVRYNQAHAPEETRVDLLEAMI